MHSSITSITVILFVLVGSSIFLSQPSARAYIPSTDYHSLQRRLDYEDTPPLGDHPDWSYANGIPLWKLDSTAQDHFRFHAYLAMSIYGNFTLECPKTFLQGFTVLESIAGKVYTAFIPEMKKIVIVFGGVSDYTKLSWDPVPIDWVSECDGCMVAKGIRDLYLDLKTRTQDFKIAKDAVARTNMLFSVTGLGVGGAIAALAALDLGSRNYVHYAHQSGAPRAFNYKAVVRYDNLFQFLAGQSLVHRNDYMVQIIPRGVYQHVGQKVEIHGDKTQWAVTCFGNNENSTCLGDGTSREDHYYYFTPIGFCGSADKGF